MQAAEWRARENVSISKFRRTNNLCFRGFNVDQLGRRSSCRMIDYLVFDIVPLSLYCTISILRSSFFETNNFKKISLTFS